MQVCRIIVFGVFFGPGGLSYVQIGPGIQNFTKILPAYMRTRVSHCPMYAQRHQETKVILLKIFLSAFFPTSWSKIRRFSDFSTHLYILYMCAKIRKLKVATQYFALKTLNRESYFLRKWIFFKKTKKNAKQIKNNFFFFYNPSLPPYFEICKKKKFRKIFRTSFIRVFPNLSQFSNFVWDNGDKNGDSDGDV